MVVRNSELQLQLTKAQSKLEERVDEFAVIREEIKERRKSQVNLPSIQVRRPLTATSL